jgi:hypothetical protein
MTSEAVDMPTAEAIEDTFRRDAGPMIGTIQFIEDRRRDLNAARNTTP